VKSESSRYIDDGGGAHPVIVARRVMEAGQSVLAESAHTVSLSFGWRCAQIARLLVPVRDLLARPSSVVEQVGPRRCRSNCVRISVARSSSIGRTEAVRRVVTCSSEANSSTRSGAGRCIT